MPRRPDVSPGHRALHEWSWDEASPWSDAMTYALAERYGAVSPAGGGRTTKGTATGVRSAAGAAIEGLVRGGAEAYPLDLADIDDQRILWDRIATT
ncbi:hypothetical protein [Streptomyces puniciscabiei]|uniref:hypothetical protein n=1 Tax=Streptomyces puniciscabiei TaxID=164348 RepID=UPI000A9C2B33|nr:hypothetical protein [Streptomyces puniciscabiei]